MLSSKIASAQNGVCLSPAGRTKLGEPTVLFFDKLQNDMALCGLSRSLWL